MKTRPWIYALLFASVIVFSACDDDDDKPSLNDTDENFVENAALANKTEIEFGQLAATKGNTEMVRQFGQQMVDEHTTALNELRDIANDYGNVDLPDELDEQHKQIRQQLMDMTGYSFDSLYMESQVMDHENTLNLFQTEAGSGTVQKVKDYASKYVPHIQMHLEEANTIHMTLMMSSGN